jgi:zinc transporter ZupT
LLVFLFYRYRKPESVLYQKNNTRFLSVILGFSAGVMIKYSFISSLSEPLGTLVGYVLLSSLFDITFGILFATVAGIMVYISLDELLSVA